MLISFVRTLILYSLVVIVMRVMGKRQISQLQPFELVVAIMLSELAAIPMQNTSIPLINGIIPIFTLLIAQVTFAYLSLKSETARKIICGSPSILIENGKILENELIKLRLSLTDLMEFLRMKNFANIADIEFAILETSGELSIIPKSQKRPVTPEDLQLSTEYEGLPQILIIDGNVDHKSLAKANLDMNWLQNELNKFNIKNTKDVLFASLDTSGKLYFQLKNKAKKQEV